MEKLKLTTKEESKKKNPEYKTYRRITLEEAKQLDTLPIRYELKTILNNGFVGNIRLNGKVKRWKRDKDRIEIPVKYGLYEYYTFTNRDYMDILVEI